MSLLILFAASLLVGCSEGNPGAENQPVSETQAVAETKLTRQCFRNEYPFENEPGHKDVEWLVVEINGDRAVGEYSWLPAFKDRRVGRFEGTIDGQSVAASYEYTLEGQSAIAMLSIALESNQAVVEGESPELGLNATIARVDC